MARTSGEDSNNRRRKRGLLFMLSKERQDPTGHVGEEQNTETNGTKDGTGHSDSRKGKTNLQKTKILETEICSRHFEQGFRSRQGSLRGQASDVYGYDGLVHGQRSDRRSDDLQRKTLQRQEEGHGRGQSSSRFLVKSLDSWKTRATARQTKSPQKLYKTQSQI